MYSFFIPECCILLYDTNILGDKVKEFHTQCGRIPNTFTHIETTKGIKFAGFTTIPWLCKFECSSDKEAFLLSITFNKIFPKNKESRMAIGHNIDYGPTFGALLYPEYYPDLYISDSCTSNSSSGVGCNKYYGTEDISAFFLNKGEQYFQVKSYQVYKLNK